MTGEHQWCFLIWTRKICCFPCCFFCCCFPLCFRGFMIWLPKKRARIIFVPVCILPGGIFSAFTATERKSAQIFPMTKCEPTLRSNSCQGGRYKWVICFENEVQIKCFGPL